MNTAEIDAGNDLVRIEPGSALSVFTSPNAIDPLLKRVRDEIDKFDADVATRSTINKAARDAIARNGVPVEIAELVIAIIARKEIPHVVINY